MRLQLSLKAIQRPALIPFNYQYPLSAAIYRIIQSADQEFARFLHDQGYGVGFKLFCFSDLRTPFVKAGDRMQLQTGLADLVVCFYVPEAAENFIKGLFLNQQLVIADRYSRTVFQITQVESQPVLPLLREAVLLHPLSPLVVGRKNSRGHYDYCAPEDPAFSDCLIYNWVEKLAAVRQLSEESCGLLREKVRVGVRLFAHPPQQRLITIKGGTEAETKIRGYTKFRLEVEAPGELLELALHAGLGLHNAQGMGCVAVVG